MSEVIVCIIIISNIYFNRLKLHEHSMYVFHTYYSPRYLLIP